MSQHDAMMLMKQFQEMDNYYKNCDRKVENLLNQGYTPDEALMLAGFGGYNN